MKKNIQLYIFTIFILILSSCSVSRFIPEGQCLLDEMEIVSDNKAVTPISVKNYVRQKPNAKWFNSLKVPLGIYCLSGKDSSSSVNRFFRRMGEAPEIYDPVLASKSRLEIEKAVRNRGYMQATVVLDTIVKKNKLKAIYRIKTGRPYVVRHIAYHIDDWNISGLIDADSLKSYLKKGMVFNVETLEQERVRITKLLRNNGYYKFNKDYLVYQADTAKNTFQVDLLMKLLPFLQKKEDKPSPHKPYTIKRVNVLTTDDMVMAGSDFSRFDSLHYNGMNIYFKDRMYLRPKTIDHFNYIRPDKLYDEEIVQNTFVSLGRLRALKFTNIHFDEYMEGDSACLSANVFLTKGKRNSLAFEIEGTNSAGNLGAAASMTYQNRNVFRGSETFTAKIHGGFEAITNMGEEYQNSEYKDYGLEISLNFPEFKFPFLSSEFRRKIHATSEIGANFNMQLRPEFHRTLVSASWNYLWTGKRNTHHRVDLLNVSYVYFPWRSEAFMEYLTEKSKNNISLIHSYEDQLIVRTGYTFTYNSANDKTRSRKRGNSYFIRVNLEESGNLLYLASKAFKGKPKDNNQYMMASLPFAQYLKGDFDYTQNWEIDHRNSLVFHIGLGIAYPYGNSRTLPFEKQYFSGGPNSVRGWSVRSLGPGSYRGIESNLDYYAQVGDIKLDLNLEYRTRLFWKLNGAIFVDAGNIWNITDHLQDEAALFRFNRFYKQLAVAYGLGIRFDFDFLILRFDGGMKAVNPMLSGKDKYPFVHPDFNRDFTFHFAVGYPF